MKKPLLLFTTRIVNIITGTLQNYKLFRLSRHAEIWQNPDNAFHQTLVLFFAKQPEGKDYSLIIQQNEYTAVLSFYAKGISLNQNDGDIGDKELLLFTVTLGSQSNEGDKKITPTFDLNIQSPLYGESEIIAMTCLNALEAARLANTDGFDFKTTQIINKATPPPNLKDLFEELGLINSPRVKKPL